MVVVLVGRWVYKFLSFAYAGAPPVLKKLLKTQMPFMPTVPSGVYPAASSSAFRGDCSAPSHSPITNRGRYGVASIPVSPHRPIHPSDDESNEPHSIHTAAPNRFQVPYRE